MFSLNLFLNFLVTFLFLGLFILICLPIVYICSAISVYKDAKYRGENATFLVVLDIFGGGFIAPIFYILNIVKPYNQNPSNIAKKIPLGLLIKLIFTTVIVVLGFILISMVIPFGIGLFISFTICFVSIFSIALYCLKIASIYALYKDAKARKENSTLWGILSIFFNIITLLVYVIVVIKSKSKNTTILEPSPKNANDTDFVNQLSFDDFENSNNNVSSPSNKVPVVIILQIIFGIIPIFLNLFFNIFMSFLYN